MKEFLNTNKNLLNRNKDLLDRSKKLLNRNKNLKASKKIKKIIPLIIPLVIIYIYILFITNFPNNIIIFEGEKVNLKTIFGISLQSENEVINASSTDTEKLSEEIGTTRISLNIFNKIPVKEVSIDVIPKTKVIPVGNVAGVKLYTSGVLIVGMSEIQGEDQKNYKPYENTDIKEGDTIIKINDTEITSTEDLIQTVNNSKGNELEIEYMRNQNIKECSITPVKTGEDEYKLGLWVRDSAAGVGTVTFYEPSTKSFAALGHGIMDIDTEQLIDIASGEFVTTKILNITKGEDGLPGKIQGTVANQNKIGTIAKNTKFGIYGKVDNLSSLNIDSSKEMEVALREEIKTGKAAILCSLENGKVEEYEIEIEEIYKENNYDNKSMKIKITDQDLLNRTNGIIQGMSGSPIIQNGKFIGAVTSVLVNNPHEGYAIFGDLMIKQLRSVE